MRRSLSLVTTTGPGALGATQTSWGTTLYVNGIDFTIVGVAAEGFEGLESGKSTDFWIPLQSRPELNAWGNPPENGKTNINNPAWWCMQLVGRLAPGVTKAQAVAQLQPAFQRASYIGLGSPKPGERMPTLSLIDAKGFPGYAQMYGKPLRLLMAMVGLVLLIALTNVVMLLVTRNAARQREFSVRLALGAGRADLLRQLLAESLLLASAGGLLAWLFAIFATGAGFLGHIESSLAPDRTVLLFSLSILALAALLFGLAPLRDCARCGPGVDAQNVFRNVPCRRGQIAHREIDRRIADDPMPRPVGRRGTVDSNVA